MLLVRIGALGDLLLLRRGIALLRRAGCRVSLLAPVSAAVLVGAGASEVDERLSWEAPEVARMLGGEHAAGPVAAALARADFVVAYSGTTALTTALEARARRLVSHPPAPPASGPHASLWLTRPIVERLLPAGGSAASPVLPPDLVFTEAEQDAARAFISRLPSRFVAIHPGSGSPSKNWSAERFLALARRLAGGERFLLALGPAELDADAADALVVRDPPLRVLGALLARASLFVGNDSGVSHLAAACGTPTLALFGPTDPLLWSPVGRRVRWLRAPRGQLERLSVEAVAEAAAELPL